MITSEQVKNVVLPCVALHREKLTDKLLKCELDDMKAIRIAIDEFKQFETFLERELKKESSDFLKKINEA